MPKPPGSRFQEPVYPRPPLPPAEAILAYYRAAAALMLPYLAKRPLNLLRCSGEKCFFQRNRDHPHTGEGFFKPPILQFPIAQKNGRTESYLYVDGADGILAACEAKGIEFHGWGSRIDQVEKPDRIAFDLDPGEGIGFSEVKEAAFQFRRSLDAIGLEAGRC